MNGRRAAALAASVTLALLVTGGTAAAAPADDAPEGLASSAVVAEAEPGIAEAPLADAAGQDQIAMALSGTANTAYGLINQIRRSGGVASVTQDDLLNKIAQDWANRSARENELVENPELLDLIPGYPVEDSYVYELGVRGTKDATPADMVEYIADRYGDTFYAPEVTHVGVGWSVGSDGVKYVYFVYVQYPFRDLGPSKAFHEEVDWLAWTGITGGYGDGTFRASTKVNRQQMAAFLYRYFNVGPAPACTGAQRLFADVPTSHPFCAEIEWLAGSGITGGYGDGTFRGTTKVNRQQMAAFLYRSVSGGPTEVTCSGTRRQFSDIPASHPFCGEIEWLAGSGITGGYGDGTYRPTTAVSRGQMAAFLFRATPSV